MKKQFVELTDHNGNLIVNPELVQTLGRPVPLLIPCLDPDLDSKEYKNEELMTKRVYDNDPTLAFYNDEETNVNDLTEKCPYFVDFVPTSEIVSKLYKRMQ